MSQRGQISCCHVRNLCIPSQHFRLGIAFSRVQAVACACLHTPSCPRFRFFVHLSSLISAERLRPPPPRGSFYQQVLVHMRLYGLKSSNVLLFWSTGKLHSCHAGSLQEPPNMRLLKPLMAACCGHLIEEKQQTNCFSWAAKMWHARKMRRTLLKDHVDQNIPSTSFNARSCHHLH